MTDNHKDNQKDISDSQPPNEERNHRAIEDQIAAVLQLLDAGEGNKALKPLRRLYKSNNDHPEICYLWGLYYLNKEEHSQAAKWFGKAIQMDPRSCRFHEALIDTYWRDNKAAKAIEALRTATRDSDEPLQFYRWLENALLEMKDSAGAASLLKEIRSRYAGQPELLFIQGEAAFALSLYPTAIDFFRQCYEKEYVDGSMEHFLARTFAHCNYDNYALNFLRAALRRDRTNRYALDALRELLWWRLKTGNEKLLAAVQWRLSVVAKQTGALLKFEYLNFNGDEHIRVLEAWLGEKDKPVDPYTCICEFYKDILRDKPDFASNWFNASDSLLACVAHLTLKKDEIRATYYKAWHSLLTGQKDSARDLFKSLRGRKRIPKWVRHGCKEALEDIRRPPETPPLEEAQSKPEVATDVGSDSQNKAETQVQALEAIETFGFNISGPIGESIISPATGLDAIVDKITDALTSGSGRGIILIGPSGVGKTAAIRQLALFLQSERAPAALKGYSVFQTSTSRLLAGAKYIGTWQQNLEQLCLHASAKNKIIIYFEDIANVLGAGAIDGDSTTFVDYLIPRIELKDILMIGEMESGQAHEVFSRDPRFARIAREIQMFEPPKEAVLKIIEEVAKREGANKGITFSSESLSEVIELSSTFMPYKAFPGKAIEIIYQATSEFGNAERAEPLKIGNDDIVLAFCELTGIPPTLADKNQLLDSEKMSRFFEERILGQPEALRVLMEAVTVFKARMCDSRKPVRSFLFVGPTGVGKTEAAKVLAEYVFGSRERLIHINMSEYSDGQNAVTKLIGTHWMQKKTSRFIDTVRAQPLSVVLLDEIEKASYEARNLLLQLLDEGVLIDGAGKPVHFQSTFIIMTSNIGSRRYTSRAIGFGPTALVQEAQDGVLSDIEEFFSPEIFNRFDEVICFKPLTRSVLSTIINREIGKVLERNSVVNAGLSVDVDPTVKDLIIETGFDPKYGARHIKRAVERSVAMPLAALLVSQPMQGSSQIQIVISNGKPVACYIPDDSAEKLITRPSHIPKSPTFELRIDNKELKKLIISAEDRIGGLRSLLKVDDIKYELEQLQGQMASPTFWDDHIRANQTLKRIAELTRCTERVGRWDYALDQVRLTLQSPSRGLRRDEVTRAKNSLIGLLQDIESAELEVLLRGRYDSADVFLIISTEGGSKSELNWLLDLADMYIGWSKRRGYRCTVVGEQPGERGGDRSIVLLICGMNAFGLLKNERGIHRRAVTHKTGNRNHAKARQTSPRLDCRVLVLADVQSSGEKGETAILDIKRVSPPIKGWRLKQLSRKVCVKENKGDTYLEFLADAAIERDKALPLDLLLSFSYYSKNPRPPAGAQERQLGSLVRTYESGARSRVLDHATKATVSNMEDFLSGNIDSILLERLL